MAEIPCGNNPINIALSEQRKQELAKIIRKYSLLANEDDNYSSLLQDGYTPLALSLPDNCIYVSGLSSLFAPDYE